MVRQSSVSSLLWELQYMRRVVLGNDGPGSEFEPLQNAHVAAACYVIVPCWPLRLEDLALVAQIKR